MAKKAAAYQTAVSLVSVADTTLHQDDPTLAAGDVKVSKDFGAYANLTTLPAVAPAGSASVQLDLSSAEMNADIVIVRFRDQTDPKEWGDLTIVIGTTARTQDELDADVEAILEDTGTTLDGRIPAALTADGNIKADALRLGGAAQTGRDIGASVLLSSGTGTGQLDFSSGVVKSNLAQILGTALTETAGLIAAGFKKFFNVATPTGTVNSLPDAVPGAAGGVFIAGTNAATTVTTALTTTFTGNLTGNVGGNVVGSVASLTTNNDKTGYSLSSTGLNAITPAEPAAVPAFASATLPAWIAWLGAWSRNKITETDDTLTLRNNADNADIASTTISDDNTTATRGKLT